MSREEVLLKIKEIETRSKLPAFEKNYTEKDYAIKELERIIFKLLDTTIEIETIINTGKLMEYFKGKDFNDKVNRLGDNK